MPEEEIQTLTIHYDQERLVRGESDLAPDWIEVGGVRYAPSSAGSRTARDEERQKMGVIGRERFLIDKLTKTIRLRGADGHAVSDWTSETKRGSCFEVLIQVDGKPTGHVARVTVELDRFDRELADQYALEQARR